MRIILALFLAFFLFDSAMAASAYSPRHSGLEPPGGPRRLDSLPGASPGRTSEGGMGYQDAYGNTLTDKIPEAKKQRPRLRPGAYGKMPQAKGPGLPESKGQPVWSFK